MKKLFAITDNKKIYNEFKEILDKKKDIDITYYCSPKSKNIFKYELESKKILPIILKKDFYDLISMFDFGLSCHSKQIFPAKLVKSILCINIHPGLNPYNRGWYPQVFSIINGLPVGATIHVMDEKIDHGDIIVQEEIEINATDNSLSVYRKVQDKEIELLKKSIDDIISLNFKRYRPISNGNYNSIQDYKQMCEINLNKKTTMKDAIDFFRAMSHPPYNNCFFKDDDGKKIFVTIELKRLNN